MKSESQVNFNKIEKKWQKCWEDSKTFQVNKNPKKKKFYVLEMFPYPSGSGLHMGHASNYTIGDIYARFKRMQGFNVLHPMGYDSFGLPAENAAIKEHIHPKTYTENAIKNFINQQKSLGLSYDWSRLIKTHSPEYYKFNQYFFLQFLKEGLVYRKKSAVNWCSRCQTVLANEQVHNGKCWRHSDTEVEIKILEQWFFKTTKYAEELLREIEKLNWPERIKIMQRNWLGKSEGTEILFEIQYPKEINFVLLHGFTGNPEANFFPWLKKELESRGHKVTIPKLPNTNTPNIVEQIDFVLKNCKFDENSILLGHSLGAIVAMKVVEKLKKPIKKLILAAGFLEPILEIGPYNKLFNWKFDFEKIKKNSKEIIIFRDLSDKDIPSKQADKLKENLEGKLIDFMAEEEHICGDQEPEVLNACMEKWPIFTTRPDTLFGVTFLVISAQHPRLSELVTKEQKSKVSAFIKKIKSTKQADLDKLEKEGIFTGGYASHPLTKEKIPIWTGNFVVADYGSGMVMAVPAHDQRDFEFAKKYKLPIRAVVQFDETKIVMIVESLKQEFYKKAKNFGTVIEKDGLIEIYTDKVNEIFELAKDNFIGAPWYIHSEGKIKKILLHSKNENKIFDWSNKQENEKAKEFGLKIGIKKEQLDYDELRGAYVDSGKLINSGDFDDLFNEEAKEHITKALEFKKLGKKKIEYKLRDWLISRQRYWGTPIPIVYCDKCGIVPVAEKDFPVLLPEKVTFGKGNPLAANKKFVNVKCPHCESAAKRETDTMDTFIDSSWYYLRFCDSQNLKEPFDKSKVKHWMPVDQYIGGAEHAAAHLIYARFFSKILRDMNYVNFNEPFPNLFNQGMLHGEDGFVMSKSRGNVVDPKNIISKYSADTLRFFLVSMGSPDKDSSWIGSGIEGSFKFVKKIYETISKIKKGKTNAKVAHKLNKTIKAVTAEIENFRYNFATIKLRELFESLENEMTKQDIESLIKLVSPFCPHITEELWEKIGNKPFVSLEKWPSYDDKKINEKYDKAEESFEKTISDILNILNIVKEKQKKEAQRIYLYVLPNEIEFYNLSELSKRIGKEIKIFAVNNKSKYDPENKSSKTKPGKPAIFVE